MIEPNYTFDARVLRVIDGDTFEVQLDRGFHDGSMKRLRLLDVNCPEVRGLTRAAGDRATEFTREWILAAGDGEWPFTVQTTKADAFGRYLATVWRRVDKACLNVDLITEGHAVPDIR